MKKNKLKYVLIPAFTTAAMFPIFADNNAKASDESTTVAATQPKKCLGACSINS